MAPTFKCNYCGKDFTRKHNMNRHVRLSHSPDLLTVQLAPTIFQCTIKNCTRQYMNKESLVRHQRLKHGVITIENKHTIVTCQFCGKQMQSDELKAHVETTHTADEKPDVETTQKIVVKKPDVETTQKVDVKKPDVSDSIGDDCVMIVEQFVTAMTSDQPVQNPVVRRLIDETDRALKQDYYHYIALGNTIRLAYECSTENKSILLNFVDELTGSIKFDLESQFNFKWMILMFGIGRELLRRMPSYREQVTDMLIYFLLRAGRDLHNLGGWSRFVNEYFS